jgi:hypothetical protein
MSATGSAVCTGCPRVYTRLFFIALGEVHGQYLLYCFTQQVAQFLQRTALRFGIIFVGRHGIEGSTHIAAVMRSFAVT